MLDSLHLNVAAEDGVDDLVQDVRVLHFRLDQDLLALGTLGLNVVLPEVPLLLARAALAALAVRTGAFKVTVICKNRHRINFI